MTTALWCKSNGSFLEGASHPEELVDQAIEFGLRHLAITDRDGVYASVRAHVAARSTDLHLIHGAQVTLDDQSSILLLVRDQEGWANLCSLLTKGRLRCPKGQSRVSWDEVCSHAGGLFALWGGRESLLVGEADPWFVYRKLRHAYGERLHALVSRHREAGEVNPRQRTPRTARPRSHAATLQR